MQRTIVAIGAGLVLTFGSTALAESNAPADGTNRPVSSASGPEWCGFHNKAGDRVRCGFSTEADCKKAIGGPDAVCIVDPYLT